MTIAEMIPITTNVMATTAATDTATGTAIFGSTFVLGVIGVRSKKADAMQGWNFVGQSYAVT